MEQQFDRLNEQGALKSYITHYGKDNEGNQILPKVEYVGIDEVKGLLFTAKFKSVYLEAKRDGTYKIVTKFYLDGVTSTGWNPDSANSELTFETPKDDAQQFINSLFPLVETSIINVISILIGHDDNRFFSPTGDVQNSEEHKSKPAIPYVNNAAA